MTKKNKKASAPKAAKVAQPKPVTKRINLALQGGGTQGAFTWGVLDALLASGKVEIAGISATSGGAMNAAVMAYGLITGGPEKARQLLEDLWRKVSAAASLVPFKPSLVDKLFGGEGTFSPAAMAMDYMTRIFSPYQFNLFDLNPLRNILEELIDFEAIRKNKDIKLFINATNVRTGKIRVFETSELTLDMVMASACIPFIFKTVYVDGEPYWDGGYSGNPAIYPLIYHTDCNDVVLVQISPINVADVPTNASDIMERVNEISFNSTLMREMRAVAFVSKLIEQGKLTEDRYKDMCMHMIESDEIIQGLSRTGKLNADWDFLTHMKNVGVQASSDWLEQHYAKIGKESTLDIHKVFL